MADGRRIAAAAPGSGGGAVASPALLTEPARVEATLAVLAAATTGVTSAGAIDVGPTR